MSCLSVSQGTGPAARSSFCRNLSCGWGSQLHWRWAASLSSTWNYLQGEETGLGVVPMGLTVRPSVCSDTGFLVGLPSVEVKTQQQTGAPQSCTPGVLKLPKAIRYRFATNQVDLMLMAWSPPACCFASILKSEGLYKDKMCPPGGSSTQQACCGQTWQDHESKEPGSSS